MKHKLTTLFMVATALNFGFVDEEVAKLTEFFGNKL